MTPGPRVGRRSIWATVSRGDSTLIVTFLSLMSAMLVPALVGVLLPTIADDFGAPEALVGTAISACFLAGVVVAPCSARAIRRLSARRVTQLCTVLSAAGLLGVAASKGALALGVGLGTAGVALAMVVPAGSVLMLEHFGRRSAGPMVGLVQSGIPCASLTAGMLAPSIALATTWRTTVASAVVFPLLACSLSLRRSKDARHSDSPLRERNLASKLTERPVIRVVVAAYLSSIVVGGLTAFFVAGASQAGLSATVAGGVVAAGSVVGLVIRAFGVGIAARHGWRFVGGAAVTLTAASAGLLVMSVWDAAYAVAGVVAIAGAAGWPSFVFAAILERFEARASSVSGLVQSGGLAGVATGPLAVGLLTARWGYGVGWQVLAVTSLLGALLVQWGAR